MLHAAIVIGNNNLCEVYSRKSEVVPFSCWVNAYITCFLVQLQFYCLPPSFSHTFNSLKLDILCLTDLKPSQKLSLTCNKNSLEEVDCLIALAHHLEIGSSLGCNNFLLLV